MALTDPINTLIRRLRLSVGADGLTVTMGSGSCYLPNTRRLISDGSSSVTLVNPTVSTWYFAYAYEASPGIAGLELSPVVPDVPYGSTARTKTGDTTRRYIGSVYVQSTGLIRPFRMLNSETLGSKVLFSASSAAGSVPIPALLNFTNSTATNIALNPLIPATATHAVLDVKNASNRTAYFSNPENGAASPTNWILCAMPNESIMGDIELSSTQQISGILSTLGLLGGILGAILSGQVNIYVQGYYYDR